MSQILKRVISLVLALTLVLSVAPVSALSELADENDADHTIGDTVTVTGKGEPEGSIPELSVWRQESQNPVCSNLYEHTHTDITGSCYKLDCTHKNGHLDACYNRSYQICLGESDSHQHTAMVNVSDVVTFDENLNFPTWSESHGAYSIYYAAYYAAYNAAYNAYIDKNGEGLGNKLAARAAGRAAGKDAVNSLAVCYTSDAEASCEHGNEHSDSCYKLRCFSTEHTHSDACYETKWKLYADRNDNGKADATSDDPYFTVTFKDDDKIFENVKIENVLKSEISTELFTGAIIRPGYTWEWGDPDITDAEGVFGIGEAHTAVYTLKWTAIDYIITWDHGEGSWADADVETNDAGQIVWTKHYGDNLTAPEVLAPTDKHFLKWTPVINDVSESVTYTAEFTNDTIVHVTYYIDNVKYAELPINVSKNEKVVAPADPADEKIPSNQMFVEWDQDLDGVEVKENTEVHAVLATDVNGNKVPDKDETISVSVTVAPNKDAGEVILSNGNHTTVTKNDDGSYSVLYDSTKISACTIKVSATAGKTEETYTAYYLSDINDNGPTDLSVAVGNVKVTFTLETFSLKALEDGKTSYEIKANGYGYVPSVDGLKEAVLDAIIDGEYNADDYTVYYYYKGATGLFDGYYKIGSAELSKYFNGLKIGEVNTFKVVKLSKSNKSGVDLYHEGIQIKLVESREEAELDLSKMTTPRTPWMMSWMPSRTMSPLTVRLWTPRM